MQEIILPKDEIIRRYLAGETARDIGVTYNVSYQTILNRLKAWGIQPRPPHTMAKKYDEIEICTKYWLGATVPELHEEYGMSKSHAYKILRKHKVPMRTPHNRISDDKKEGVRLLRRMWNMSTKDIMKHMELSKDAVNRILQGK